MRTQLLRPLGTVRWIAHQITWGARNSADICSFLRYGSDVVLYHVLGVIDLPWADHERKIRLRGGVELTYRLNRGDIQGIREVWVDEVYRPPDSVHPDVVIDLGANIGLTSVFLSKRYGASTVLAVEPFPANCRIAEENFLRNGVSGRIIEAAVGPAAGTAYFEPSRDSNLGRVGDLGVPVRVVSMQQLLMETPDGRADLVKIDIEGGEDQLLKGDISWLGSVASVLAEFHPPLVDYGELVCLISGAGFSFIPGGTIRKASADCFVSIPDGSA